MLKKLDIWIILAAIGLVSGYSLTDAMFHGYYLGLASFIGYGLWLFVTILVLAKVKRMKMLMGLFLVFASLNLFQFTRASYEMGFYLSIFGGNYSSLSIQPLGSVLLIFFLVVNRASWIPKVRKVLTADPGLKQEQKERLETKFYEGLKHKPDAYLMAITGNRKDYQPECVKAATRLIDERQGNQTT